MQLRLDGTHAVTPLVQTPNAERNGEVSPDGRWLAYEANDSGRYNIYVRRFSEVSSGYWQVTTEGGTRPLWARNSQELFYLSVTGAVMRVAVAPGPTWAPTAPTKLFEGRYGAAANQTGRTYDVSLDGRRFLMIKPIGPRTLPALGQHGGRPALGRRSEAPRAYQLTFTRQSHSGRLCANLCE
jgi:serine/threonine-protein kinase